MKEFDCGSLVPSCKWTARHADEAEVIRQAAKHLRETHNHQVGEATVEAIRSRIEPAQTAA